MKCDGQLTGLIEMKVRTHAEEVNFDAETLRRWWSHRPPTGVELDGLYGQVTRS